MGHEEDGCTVGVSDGAVDSGAVVGVTDDGINVVGAYDGVTVDGPAVGLVLLGDGDGVPVGAQVVGGTEGKSVGTELIGVDMVVGWADGAALMSAAGVFRATTSILSAARRLVKVLPLGRI